MEEQYRLKKIVFLGREVSIICQNVNGPCPLIAICNVLLLRGYISIQKDRSVISSEELIQMIANRLLETNSPLENSDLVSALQKAIEDVIILLPHLVVGLDVNVRFSNIHDFEYTSGCAVFDLLDINLVHGWLPDEKDVETVNLIQKKSYNELIEHVVDYRSAREKQSPSRSEQIEDLVNSMIDEVVERLVKQRVDKNQNTTSSLSGINPKLVKQLMLERRLSENSATKKLKSIFEKGPCIERFLESTASQLTDYGLRMLHQYVKERELCVFFRNNHFATMFRLNGILYLLVTDTGYYDEPSVVWEKLNHISGDTEYCTFEFQSLSQRPATPLPSPTSQNKDFQFALQLQQEESNRFDSPSQPPVESNLSFELRDENKLAADVGMDISPEMIQAQMEAEAFYKKQQQQKQQQSQQIYPSSRQSNPSSTRVESSVAIPLRQPFENRERDKNGRKKKEEGGCCLQ